MTGGEAMMIQIPEVLTAAQVAEVRRIIDAADWVDGNVTSGPQAVLAKRNRQLPEDSRAAKRAREIVLDALGKSLVFIAAALPAKIWPPLFNRYGAGERFAMHVDNAVRVGRDSNDRLRSDLSATLFLSDPDSYEGGELMVEDTYGAHAVKLAAGDLILYPASSLHHVTPVTSGERVASFFWIQSMIREDSRRRLLFEMDVAVQRLAGELGQSHDSVVALTGSYHNLLRMWADV
jgi:PKHD-type hydroxylase